MASEASVAPKERVNIRYKPATGDAKEEVELPHKLLVIGDFTQRADATPLGERKRAEINKDNFADVMRSQNLALDLKVKNELDSDPEAGDLAVSLKVGTLKDLEPEQVAKQVPELNKLLELRTALVYEVRVIVEDKDNRLRLGMPATVRIAEGDQLRDGKAD